jgi:hypothetical protein
MSSSLNVPFFADHSPPGPQDTTHVRLASRTKLSSPSAYRYWRGIYSGMNSGRWNDNRQGTNKSVKLCVRPANRSSGGANVRQKRPILEKSLAIVTSTVTLWFNEWLTLWICHWATPTNNKVWCSSARVAKTWCCNLSLLTVRVRVDRWGSHEFALRQTRVTCLTCLTWHRLAIGVATCPYWLSETEWTEEVYVCLSQDGWGWLVVLGINQQ